MNTPKLQLKWMNSLIIVAALAIATFLIVAFCSKLPEGP